MEKNIHNICPICGSGRLKNLKNYHNHHLTKCSLCSLVFSFQIPSHQALESHYEGYGRNDYLSPITVKRYNELLDQFEPYRKTNRILDIGCGIGYFLEVAKKRGWEVYGTEYTDEAIKICESKGIKMHKGDLNANMFPSVHFDIITAFEVIEHIAFPIELLNTAQHFLRPGGGFYLTTPNFNSILRRHLGAKWNVISYPEHLSYFTRHSLNYALKTSGFKKKYIHAHGLSITRLKTSKGTSKEKYISSTSSDEKIRESFEKNKSKQLLKSVINQQLSLWGIGDSLKAFAIKKPGKNLR